MVCLLGYVLITEEIRSDVDTIVKQLQEIGIHRVVMLTGDNEKKAQEIANSIHISEVYSNLLPEDKLEKIQFLKQNNTVVFVGDGINDAPVLAAADFSISIGEGTEIANNTADSILISNSVGSLPNIIKIARKSMHIIRFNLIFSLLIKCIVLILALFSITPIWLAILADTGVTLITVLNAIRIFR